MVLVAILGASFAFLYMLRRLKAARASQVQDVGPEEKPELGNTAAQTVRGALFAAEGYGHVGSGVFELNGEPQPPRELSGQPVRRPVELGPN